MLTETPVKFESCQSLERAGLLFLLPFLVENGLFDFKNHYSEIKNGYYYISFIFQLLAYLYLGRIKNPEQTKQISSGEFGKLMGIDRIPEVKCLRNKIKSVVEQEQSKPWNIELSNKWIDNSNRTDFYYIDGHVIVYSGDTANLGKKHVARQKLCLPGMQEFWINDENGQPYFFVTGEVNEKLLAMISEEILPKLLTEITPRYTEVELAEDIDLPRFTIVFDREGYSPKYFGQLWKEHRVAVLTYKKNVKNTWNESDFKTCKVKYDGFEEEMRLAEKKVVIAHVEMREIRKLSDDGHQTTIITTNKKLGTQELAIKMFSRWSQENYFKYMRKEYDIDRMAQHLVEDVDGEFVVANPIYNKLSYDIKKIREKISRKKAKLFELVHKNVNESIDNSAKYLKAQAKEQEELMRLNACEAELIAERSKHHADIKVKDMPKETRYNKLHQESKRFQNTIKMICYRAETSCAIVLAEYYKRQLDERRTLVKAIINAKGDLIVDDENRTITVILYSLAYPRMNFAVAKLAEILNEAEFYYPELNYRLIYKNTN